MGAHHNNSTLAQEPYVFMFKTVSAVIAAFGLPGCLLLLILILSKSKERKPHEWLLFALASSDFVFLINNITLVPIFTDGSDNVGCLFAGLFDYWFGRISFQMPALIAFNRYLSLYDLEKCKKLFTRKTSFLMFALIILIDLGWMVPFLASGNVDYDDLNHMCGLIVEERYLGATMVSFFVMDIIFYSVSFYLVFKIVLRIRAHKKSMDQCQIQSQLVKESRDIIKAMLIIMLIPVLSQMPANIVQSASIILGRPILDPWIASFFNSTYPVTAACNAYVTMYVIKDYRQSVGVIWTKSMEMIRGTRCSGNQVENADQQGAWMGSDESAANRNVRQQ